MESSETGFLRCDYNRSYASLNNSYQWPGSTFSQSPVAPYNHDSSATWYSFPLYKHSHALYDADSLKRFVPEVDPSYYPDSCHSSMQRSKDDMHSLFGDPSVLVNKLIDELEDGSSPSILSISRSTGCDFAFPEECLNQREHEESSDAKEMTEIVPPPVDAFKTGHEDDGLHQKIGTAVNDNFYLTQRSSETINGLLGSMKGKSFMEDNGTCSYENEQARKYSDSASLLVYKKKAKKVDRNKTNRPRTPARILAPHGCSHECSVSNGDCIPMKSGSCQPENDNESGLLQPTCSDEYEADLENLLKQMDRREFQESWSKDWTLGLIRFCKYMQLSEKMQIGPAIKLAMDDNKCTIRVLKKVFQSKPPTGWPSCGVRLQIQCGGFVQDILAWSNINRPMWQLIMPLIEKGITQLIKKVGGVQKLRNGHQPYFNACRNALRENNSLHTCLKEYSRGVNTNKRRQHQTAHTSKDGTVEGSPTI